MQKVPKIVSERLKVATPAVNHPDADMLAAFSEQSLLEFERAIVVEHLARCGECRDIVALALPAQDSVPAVVQPSPSGWLAWPTLRWGFVAAGIAAIALFGIVRSQHLAHPAMLADKTTASPADEAKNLPLPAPSISEANRERDEVGVTASNNTLVIPPKAPDATTARMDRAEPPAVLAPPQGGIRGGSGMGRGVVAHGPKATMQWQQQNTNAYSDQSAAPAAPADAPSLAKQQASGAMAAKVAIPPAAQTVSVQSQSPSVDAEPQNENVQIVENQPLAQLPSVQGSSEMRIEKTKAADTASSASSKMLANSLPSEAPGRAIGGSVAAAPRWAINSTGGLQRSLDQGNSWQDINVTGNPGFNGAAASLQVAAAAPSPAKAKAVAKEEKADKKDVAPLTFRAVSANGIDVWAGGSSGLLFHSTDAGSHWTRVVPSSSGGALTGDIISVQFPDIQHGKISTSTAEIWITGDGGRSWQKQ